MFFQHSTRTGSRSLAEIILAKFYMWFTYSNFRKLKNLNTYIRTSLESMSLKMNWLVKYVKIKLFSGYVMITFTLLLVLHFNLKIFQLGTSPVPEKYFFLFPVKRGDIQKYKRNNHSLQNNFKAFYWFQYFYEDFFEHVD